MEEVQISGTSESKKEINRIAYAYARVSTDDQKDGTSIEVQKNFARKLAEVEKIADVVYLEETKSASKLADTDFNIASDLYKSLSNRPQLQRIVKDAQQKRFTDLIVYSRDRLSRNLEMFIALNFFFSKRGIRIHYTKPGEMLHADNNQTLNSFFSIILGSVAELEANLISTRVKSGQEQCIRSGIWAGGRAPYGYGLKRKGNNNHELDPINQELNVVKEIFRLYTYEGLSYRKIVERLNDGNKDGPWTKSKVEGIIKNKVYLGKLVWNRRTPEKNINSNYSEVTSKPIIGLDGINEHDWSSSCGIRQTKAIYNDPKYYNTPYLLKGKLFCRLCNKPLKAKNYGKDKGSVYRCDVKKGKKPHLIIDTEYIEDIFLREFKCIRTAGIDMYWDTYTQRLNDEEIRKQKTIADIGNTIPLLTEKIHKISMIIKELDHQCNLESLKLSDFKSFIAAVKSPDERKKLVDEEKALFRQYSNNCMIRDALIAERTNQKNKWISLEQKSDQLKKTVLNRFETKDELAKKLDEFFKKDFLSLDNIKKRMIIDILVDKIIVTANPLDLSHHTIEILLKKP